MGNNLFTNEDDRMVIDWGKIVTSVVATTLSVLVVAFFALLYEKAMGMDERINSRIELAEQRITASVEVFAHEMSKQDSVMWLAINQADFENPLIEPDAPRFNKEKILDQIDVRQESMNKKKWSGD